MAVASSSVHTLADLPAQPIASRRVWTKAGMIALSLRLHRKSFVSGWTCWKPRPLHAAFSVALFYSVRPAPMLVLTLPLLVWAVLSAFLAVTLVSSSTSFLGLT